MQIEIATLACSKDVKAECYVKRWEYHFFFIKNQSTIRDFII